MKQPREVRIAKRPTTYAFALVLACLAAFAPARSFSLTLGDVTYYDVSDLGDASGLRKTAELGIGAFGAKYPELAAANAAWLGAAELSVASSRSVDGGLSSYYVRFDLSDGNDELSIDVRTDPAELSREDVADILRNLVYSFSGFPVPPLSPPVLARRFSIEGFIDDVPYASIFSPTGIAALPDGKIAFGHTQYATVVDPFLRVCGTIGKEMAKNGKYPSMNLQASASGTVIANVMSTGDLVCLNFADGIARIVVTGLSGIESYAWLGDGTLVAKEALTPRLVIVERNKRKPLTLGGYNGRYDQICLAAGPDSTLVAYNAAKKAFFFFDKAGSPIRHLVPCLSDLELAGIRGISCLPDGGLFIRGYNFVSRLDPRGYPVWKMPLEPSLGNMIMDAAWSEHERSVFMILPGNKNVYQYIEPSALADFAGSAGTKKTAEHPDYRALVAAEATFAASPEDPDTLRRLASYYDWQGAREYALSLYRTCAQLDPYDAPLAARLREMTGVRLAASAAESDARARDLMANVGPESAKAEYSIAMGLYERALSNKPGDPAILERRSSLAKAMRDAEAGINTVVPPLSLISGSVTPIFPALFASYRALPVGSVVIRNDTGTDAKNVRVSLQIPRFMDFPSASPAVERLSNGEQEKVDLFASFNRELLSVEEDLPIQARVRVEWTSDGEERSTEISVNAVVYRRTALTWDDTGKLVSFVTPNEETVNGFALAAIDISWPSGPSLTDLSRRMGNAEALIDALYVYGIRYVEDPQSPLSGMIEQPVAVDTVRFPRATLMYRGGDCDDTSALLASLFEAAGIPTAVCATPGHVFLAFDTGISEKASWELESFGEVLVSGGTLWMPVETTRLDKGLLGSWQEAGKLVAKWKGTDDFEFLTLSSLRERFPPVPLSSSPVRIDVPPKDSVSGVAGVRAREFTSLVYGEGVRALSSPAGTPPAEAKRLNRLGILHATFGNAVEATKAFQAALTASPEFFPALQNLANLCLIAGDATGAERYAALARKAKPGASSLSALESAIVEAKKGSTGPIMAEGTEKSAPRASESGIKARLSWSEAE